MILGADVSNKSTHVSASLRTAKFGLSLCAYIFVAFHCECLSRSSLAVDHDSRIITLSNIVSQNRSYYR